MALNIWLHWDFSGLNLLVHSVSTTETPDQATRRYDFISSFFISGYFSHNLLKAIPELLTAISIRSNTTLR